LAFFYLSLGVLLFLTFTKSRGAAAGRSWILILAAAATVALQIAGWQSERRTRIILGKQTYFIVIC
jgi:hypothetical protein